MWFTESSWQPIVVLVLIAAILGILWYDRRSKALLLAFLAAMAGAVAIYFVEISIVTDREKVEGNIESMCLAFQARNKAGTLRHISEKAELLRAVASTAIDSVTTSNMRVSDIQVEHQAGSSTATATFRANADITVSELGSRYQPTLWSSVWEKSSDEWRMSEVHPLNPVNGDPIEISLPWGGSYK